MELLTTEIKNKVLDTMIREMDQHRQELIDANQKDLDSFKDGDIAMRDRLVVNNDKVDSMINSVKEVKAKIDPVGQTKSERIREDGLVITNKTAPFGTIMIIYESRPDVTIEAAVLAFKANNKIILKGGKEAKNSNLMLVELWHKALEENGLEKDWITYLSMPRAEVQEFLKNPDRPIDLIVPRGGERLISFVKQHATCPVLVRGRGNNFLYVEKEADWKKAKEVILNAKTDKISACNALDKVLLDKDLPQLEDKLIDLKEMLKEAKVSMSAEADLAQELGQDVEAIQDDNVWFEEFLDMKIALGLASGTDEAIKKINHYSGGHSSSIITENNKTALRFMEQVDSGAVYHNASTRFTDGGEMGVGAELAISTDKLHHRGPLGLEQLVTNKYFIFGNGHVR